MFEIEYKGGNGVVISTKKTSLVFDPNLSLVGLKNTSVKDAVEIATEARFLVDDTDARLVIEGPGEYEVGDFSILGTPATRHIDTDSDEPVSTVYSIGIGEVKMALMGNIAAKLSEDQLELIGLVDILIIPVGGGGYTLDYMSAAKLVRQIDPKLVIPVHYSDTELSYEMPQDPLNLFTDELNAPIEEDTKYKLKSVTGLPPSLTVVHLKRS